MAQRRSRPWPAIAPLVAACCAGWVPSVAAQTSPAAGSSLPSAPSEQQNSVPGQTGQGAPPPAPSPEAATGLWDRATLLGDAGGLRTRLGNYGISVGLVETSEVLGNATGGLRRAVDYDGLLLMNLGVDTAKAFGWEGGTLNVSALQIHGRNLASDALFNLQTPSGIEANRATRLWELWYQQQFLGGKLDIKLGQQSLDQEFSTSQGGSLFINSAMGWPLLSAADLYAGGPSYPLSSLGVRVRAQPTDTVTVLAGVFDDNPPGGPFDDDSQVRGAAQSGTRFHTGTGALFIAELQYALNPPPSGVPETGAPPPAAPNTAPPPPGLPGVYKLGFWYDTGAFLDQRFDDAGRSLADPGSTGQARTRRHNFSVYGVADQVVWRPDPQGARALGVFARAIGGPGDRNLVSFSLNAGVTLKAPFPGRDNDTLGLGYGFGRIGGAVSRFDQDAARFAGTDGPVRSSESFVELTYQAQVAPWWIVQPDLQYVFTPGGGGANPLRPGQRIGNELILGVRTNLTF